MGITEFILGMVLACTSMPQEEVQAMENRDLVQVWEYDCGTHEEDIQQMLLGAGYDPTQFASLYDGNGILDVDEN